MPIKEVLIPKMTTAERNAIVSPATGLLIFNITANLFQTWTGATWLDMSSSGGGPVIIANGGTMGGTYNNSIICLGNVTMNSNTIINGNLLVLNSINNQASSYSLTVNGDLLVVNGVYFNPTNAFGTTVNGADLIVLGNAYWGTFVGDGFCTNTVFSGRGSDVTIYGNLTIGNPSIGTGNLNARGGTNQGGASQAGRGGNISISGNVTGQNGCNFVTINCTGGANYVNGQQAGNGGNITLGSCTGYGSQTSIHSTGGNVPGADGSGGNGGIITIKGASTAAYIDAGGGNSGTSVGNGGNGGTINIYGYIRCEGIIIVDGGITKDGNAGNGGTINCYADVHIDPTNWLSANGGNIYNTAGAIGNSGNGGNITCIGNCYAPLGVVKANAGDRQAINAAGNAGNGGTIKLGGGQVYQIEAKGGANLAGSNAGVPGNFELNNTSIAYLNSNHGTTGIVTATVNTVKVAGTININTLMVSNGSNTHIQKDQSTPSFGYTCILKISNITGVGSYKLWNLTPAAWTTNNINLTSIYSLYNSNWYEHAGVAA